MNKTVIQNLLLVLGSFIVALSLAEIVLRVALPAPITWKYPQESYLFDAEIGHTLRPKQQAFTHDKAVSINSQGLRDVEYSLKTAKHVTRILALGDSQTFGNGINIESTWPKQLEVKLNGQTGAGDFEVLNAGIPATDTWQHDILLQRLISIYRPDIVVLAFYVNDIVTKPPTIINLQSDTSGALKQRIIYLAKRSTLLTCMKAAYDALLLSNTPRSLVFDALLAGKSGPAINQRWKQAEQSLLSMNERATRNDVTLIVVSLPRRDQIDGRLPPQKYNERLSTMMQRTGVNFKNLYGPLRTAFEDHGNSLFIPWDGHHTASANRVIAIEVADSLAGLAIPVSLL